MILDLFESFCDTKSHVRIIPMVDNITIVEMGSYIKLVNFILSSFLETYLEMYLISFL